MLIMANKKIPKNPQKFCCEICDYYTCNKKDFSKHCKTIKHLSVSVANEFNEKIPKNPLTIHGCECGKSYTYLSSLCKHKKNCKYINYFIQDLSKTESENSVNINKDELIKYLMKENTEFKELLVEQNKMVMKVCENGSIGINNSNINSNNKTFNLNVFLNEQCKDAMNIMDFVDSLQIQLSDLENIGKLGYVEGISNIIVKKLRELDIHKRPVHCSDTKREVMYVKDENKWEKENIEKKKLRKAIKYIAHKNSKLLPEFKAKYPDCIYSDSKKSDQYNKLIIEAMGGPGDDDSIKDEKIIRNIAKEVFIDKNND
jgi:hypothetical protein